MSGDPESLEQVLERMEEAAQGSEQVSLGGVMEAVGRRSFGPLLLIPGLLLVSPLSGIPGVPTSMGIVVLLIAWQLVSRQCCWLPRWLLERSVARPKFCKAVQWMKRPARCTDRWLRPRLTLFTDGASRYAVAVVSGLVALAMPVTEIVPFSATAGGVALAALGMALIAHDGLLALVAFTFTALTLGLVAVKVVS